MTFRMALNYDFSEEDLLRLMISGCEHLGLRLIEPREVRAALNGAMDVHENTTAQRDGTVECPASVAFREADYERLLVVLGESDPVREEVKPQTE